VTEFGVSHKLHKIVCDQAANIKKAFANVFDSTLPQRPAETEDEDVVSIAEQLVVESIIARQQKLVQELEREIEEMNRAGETDENQAAKRQRTLNRDEVVII
jgi:hypothetical protein